MTKADFIERYKGKSKERYSKALRAEIAGGALLLDLLMLVHLMRDRAGREEGLRLVVIEDKLQAIRDEMVLAIRAKYNMMPLSPGDPSED